MLCHTSKLNRGSVNSLSTYGLRIFYIMQNGCRIYSFVTSSISPKGAAESNSLEVNKSTERGIVGYAVYVMWKRITASSGKIM